MFSLLATTLLFVGAVCGASIPDLTLRQNDGIKQLNQSQISFYRPYTRFASAGYCKPEKTLTWSCGADCQAESQFIPTASGGDGGAVQYWFVGYSPGLKSVIVSHQGTDTSRTEAIVTDVHVSLVSLNATMFPGLGYPGPIRVHEGFRDAQASTATEILQAVKKTIADHGTKKVTVVGHSLGAAIALIDMVYLQLHLAQANVKVNMVGYGMPRVGNIRFANYLDLRFKGKVIHINNRKDPVPNIPLISMGYHHPSGEIHIRENGNWVNCPGQDNPSAKCIVGDIPNLAGAVVADHSGPYDGIYMGKGC